jgi:hypothetical protein
MVAPSEAVTLHVGHVDGAPFNLPLELITQSVAILAKRRVGKSYTSAVIAEELLGAGQQVCIIDPTGAHWGMRSSADGKEAGFPIVVFGGDHADLPLDEHGGEEVATALVEHGFSAIIDLSLLRKGAANRLLGVFLATLYRLNRRPMHLICDEVDLYAPQKPMHDEARTLGAMEDIVRRGGIKGIGATLITQRPAVVNKNVLTQCEVLIALRLVHPKDISAVMEWVQVHAEAKQAKAMIDSLPSLPVGTAWVWSPGLGDIFAKVAVRARRTFDSGATPKAGEHRVLPKILAQVDIERLGAAMKVSADRAKADDPKELKRRIAELERQLSAKPTAPEIDVSAIEAAALGTGYSAGIRDGALYASELADRMLDSVSAIRREAMIKAETERHHPTPAPAVPARQAAAAAASRPVVLPQAAPVKHRPAGAAGAAGTAKLTKAERAVLIALAQHPAGRTKTQIAILTGYASTGGGFNNALSACRSRGYLTGGGDRMEITAAGIDALGSYEPLPSGDALLQHWLRQLSKAERACLEALANAYPRALDKAELAANAGYEPSGGGFNNALSRLRTLELIEGRGEIRASDTLFDTET